MKLLLLFLLPAIAFGQSPAPIRNVMFIGMDREQLPDTSRWSTNGVFAGVQIAYSWRQLEPQKDQYDFSLIKDDLRLLEKDGKRLFIQLQDVSFSMRWNHVPPYILADTQYH